MKKYILIALSLFVMASCSYEETNTDKYGVTDDELKMGGLIYGVSFIEMQQLIIPIGSPIVATTPGNHLQNTDLISSGNYIGYFGNNNNWNFAIESNWNFTEGRMAYAYGNFYSNLFRAWNDLNQKLKDSKDPEDLAISSVANILKVTGWLRATDVFGPIVYTQAGDGNIAPKLDSQEVVYTKMLEDLAEAAAILNATSSKVLPKYDAIYDGDAQSWTRFANSLMLRLAVRVHFKNEGLAREYIAKAIDPSNGGLIENKNQEAKIKSTDKMPLMNSMLPSVEDYAETRMGTTIWSYLNGYEDPRMEKYFTKGVFRGNEMYIPLPPTNNRAKATGPNTAEYAAKPKVEKDSPLYWMRASEVLFLKAEAALFDLMPGDAQSFYEEGVKMSFEENGLSGADKYLFSAKKPTDILPNTNPYIDYSYSSAVSLGNTSPSWSDLSNGDQKEERLQKIITQKYLALYPNAVEAWTEYRRTGYPFLTRPADGRAYARINGTRDMFVPERFRFPASEYSNPNMSEVPVLLKGDDNGSTRLWWVRADRPKQMQ